MSGLAAGRGAGVEHALPVAQVEQRSGALGARILDRHQTFCKARQALDRYGLLQHQGVRAGAARGHALAGEPFEIALLPKPFQVSALTSREWHLESDWRRFTFRVPATQPAPAAPADRRDDRREDRREEKRDEAVTK